MRRNMIGLAAIAVGAFLAAPALAEQYQSGPPAGGTEGTMQVKPGDTVYDPGGEPVGTIASIEGDTAILATGNVNVGIPISAISHGEKGHVITMTKAELEAAAKSDAPK